MTTLRARIAALLMVSIVSAVALLTFSPMYALRGFDGVVVDMLVRQLVLMDRLARQSPDAGVLSPTPAARTGSELETEEVETAGDVEIPS